MRDGSRERTRLVLVLAIGLAVSGSIGQAAAQSVQKCVAADGHVTLTSGACADGQVLAKTYDAAPEQIAANAGRTSQQREARPSQSASSARSGSRGAPRASGSRRKPAPDHCQAARDRREQTLRRVGLKRTFDLLRKLDDEVWAACR
jgi:hypothetical protein